MDEQQRKQLGEQGYLIFRNLLSAKELDQILSRLEELWAMEGDHAGEENYIEPGVRRLANLANKGDMFRSLYARPQVLEVVQTVMGPDIRASMVNARDVNLRQQTGQPHLCRALISGEKAQRKS
jgi:phytanoyl-CoA dioxygenase PhyH